MRFRSLGQADGPRPAEDFLLASRIRREDARVLASTRPYFTDSGLTTVSLIGSDTVGPRRAGAVRLPDPLPLRARLDEVLARRRSRRRFSGGPTDLAHLATLLRATAGRTGRGHVALSGGGEVVMPYHTAPSGGGLRPVAVYIAPLRVEGLDTGMLRYDDRSDVLVPLAGSADARQLLDTCLSPPDLDHLREAAAVVLFVGRPWRSMRKYGERGVRFLLLEAGAMAEHLHLSAEALGLGSVACGSLCDDEVHRIAGLDGLYELLVHVVVVGCRPDGEGDAAPSPRSTAEGGGGE
ncbi:SagB/ThcOx family dehydrogenase [Streptomyces sp. HC44]|uniref:SagB/ThcOx family dehydrogenase n=1 Tax=Streptomyces scabichelini TaxID=2711217 RepID=A0A6G4UZ31_9ACTN|nr:SagB/ThcOx family dehydrogenase [Streptomyces scabichelini]NGO07009.1 SagB/ThcOx family dehydrogenase [Streptomyces scabichelini]